jgi:predicted nucleic acid binding AN1-type Zn finger protein
MSVFDWLNRSKSKKQESKTESTVLRVDATGTVQSNTVDHEDKATKEAVDKVKFMMLSKSYGSNKSSLETQICDNCSGELYIGYKCRRCGKTLCADCMLVEHHDCATYTKSWQNYTQIQKRFK